MTLRPEEALRLLLGGGILQPHLEGSALAGTSRAMHDAYFLSDPSNLRIAKRLGRHLGGGPWPAQRAEGLLAAFGQDPRAKVLEGLELVHYARRFGRDPSESASDRAYARASPALRRAEVRLRAMACLAHALHGGTLAACRSEAMAARRGADAARAEARDLCVGAVLGAVICVVAAGACGCLMGLMALWAWRATEPRDRFIAVLGVADDVALMLYPLAGLRALWRGRDDVAWARKLAQREVFRHDLRHLGRLLRARQP